MTIRGEFVETIMGAPPEGWTLGHVTVQLHGPDERIPVEAWRRGTFAVHEVLLKAVLTHAPTGLKISNFVTMDDAVMCAEKIEPFTDWSAIKDRFKPGESGGLYERVRDVVDAIVSSKPLSLTRD
jgi:hypothetical protein